MTAVQMRDGAGSRLPVRDVAKFTAAVALLAIFWDAAVGHGLTWENDPYWSYWVTKTFLIATIFGLGTAWFGIGEGRGAIITAVHTVVLTVYYWSFSPIGLPSSPNWLDLEHTWITGLPIHFAVIYLGYLSALWLWRRRDRAAAEAEDSARSGVAALIASVAIVVLAGLLASLALGEFPGVTWFLVRLLITVPFLLLWWAAAGRDRISAVAGGVTLAFIWATYGQFVGPSGLPDLPLRIFSTDAPPAFVRWLDYKELWGISLPIYIVVMVGVLVLASRGLAGAGRGRRAAVAAAAIAALLFTTGLTVSPENRGLTARFTASGTARVETGPFYSGQFSPPGTGTIEITATDMGDRVSPLEPHDRLVIEASLRAGGHTYEVVVAKPMVSDPLGRFTTWWGVGFDVWHHGKSGIGTDQIRPVHSELAAFGLGDLTVDGQVVARGAPVHVMTMPFGTEQNKVLDLEVGDPAAGALPGVPAGHLRAVWDSFSGDVPKGLETTRYLVGDIVLLALLVAAFILNRRERTGP